MAVLIGTLLALAVGLMACYALFAVMGGSTHALLLDSLVGSISLAAFVLGFRSSPWVVPDSLAAHGILDLAHDGVISNRGVPSGSKGDPGGECGR